MNAVVLFSLVAMATAFPQFNTQQAHPVGQAQSITGGAGGPTGSFGGPAAASGLGGSAGPGGLVGPAGAGGLVGPAAAGGLGGPAGAGAGGFGGLATRRNWGPKAYGPGLNNRFALPPNPFFMERALALVNRVPNTLVRVEVNGEITITDQFGKEAEIIDAFGRDLTEGLEFD